MTSNSQHTHSQVAPCTITMGRDAKLYAVDAVSSADKKPTLQARVLRGQLIIKFLSDEFSTRSLDGVSLMYLPKKFEIELVKG